MSAEPPVTIGMPSYNGMPYIEGAVRSLLSQTYGDFVLLVSDDLSTDGTLEACARLASADGRVRVIRQTKHLGMMRNFQFVLEQARSPFFMWAAQDDLWDPDFLLVTTSILGAVPSAIACMTSIRHIGPDNRVMYVERPPQDLAAPDALLRARSVLVNRPHAEYSLFRRIRIPGQSECVIPDVPSGDVAFVFRVALQGPIALADSPLLNKRSLGYSEIVLSDGTPGWQKSLGPDGHLYSHDTRAMCKHMLSYLSESDLTGTTRAALWLDLKRIGIRGRRTSLAQRNLQLARVAQQENRYATVVGRSVLQFALAPRTTTRSVLRRRRTKRQDA